MGPNQAIISVHRSQSTISTALVLTLMLTLCISVWMPTTANAKSTGNFKGELVLKERATDNGVEFEVVEEFRFVDTYKKEWHVPPGARTDCASVPTAAFIMFPPCRGRYLRAAVVHDYYCDHGRKSNTWEVVHRMFYDALIAAKVSEWKAKTMYAAVYYFGPRWDTNGVRYRSSGAKLAQPKQEKRLLSLKDWIAANNPSLADIEARIRKEQQRY